MKNRSFQTSWLLMLVALLIAGCGDKQPSADASSFDSAPPEIKQVWDKASAADQANQYLVAAQGYQALLNKRDSLEPAQVITLETAKGKLFQRLVDAASSGDPAAKQALQNLGRMDRAR